MKELNNNLENVNKKLSETTKEVTSLQEEIRSNLKAGYKPTLEKFQSHIDIAIEKVLSNKDNEWIVALPQYKNEIKPTLYNAVELFFKEYLQNNSEPILLEDQKNIERVVEYLFFNLENMPEEIKKYVEKKGNFSSHRVVAYHNYEEINKFLNDDVSTAKELNMDLEEFQEIFTKNRRKDLVFERIANPIARALYVKNTLQTILTDENIAKELDMDIEEVKETFTKARKVHFAFKNNDPIEALSRVKNHIEKTLTDENIASALSMDINKVQEIFNKGLKLHMAIRNISDPMEAFQRIKVHLETTLTDENLAKELNMDINEVRDMFSFAIKLHIVANNIDSPLKPFFKIKDNFDNVLTENNILEKLKITKEYFYKLFTPSIIKQVGIIYISNPIKRLKEIKENFELFTDENIAQKLNMDLVEVKKLFPFYIKLQIITKGTTKTLFKKLKTFVENYQYLTDENIAKELNITVEQVKEVFPNNLRQELALIKNPLNKLNKKFKLNFFEILSYENIAKELNMDLEQVKEIFTISIRYNMAIDTDVNCVEQLHRIKKNRLEILTKENIAENLKIDIKFVDQIFSSEVLNHFAVIFPTRPIEGLKLFYNAWFKVLDSDNIAKELGVDSSLTQNLLTPGLRRMIALGRLDNAMNGLCSFILGEYSLGAYDNLRPTNPVLIEAARKYKESKKFEKKNFTK